MKTFHSLASISDLPHPISLSIGTFDGVHLGHKSLIKKMKHYGTAVIFTFSNHPREVIDPKIKIPCLTPPDQKLQLLEEVGVDGCLLMPFTQDMAGMTYNLFLEEIYTAFPFEHLFFGERAVIGKNREGTKENIEKLGKMMGFQAHYLPKLTIDHETVSSTLIRTLLAKGDLKQVEKFLGRKFATMTALANPYIDPELLKPAHYQLKICTADQTFESSGKVNKNGEISLDQPISLDPEELVTIIFEKE